MFREYVCVHFRSEDVSRQLYHSAIQLILDRRNVESTVDGISLDMLLLNIHLAHLDGTCLHVFSC